MRRALLLALVLGCAHSPEPAPGPRPLGGRGGLARSGAALDLEFRYEYAPDRTLAVLVDLTASGERSVGPARLTVGVENFAVDGPTDWSGEVAPGARVTHTIRLRPQDLGVARVKIVYGTADAPDSGEAAFAFLVEPAQIRPCQPADAACK
jgi:hypothetical protein